MSSTEFLETNIIQETNLVIGLVKLSIIHQNNLHKIKLGSLQDFPFNFHFHIPYFVFR